MRRCSARGRARWVTMWVTLVDAAVCLSVFEGKNGPMISARIKELRPRRLRRGIPGGHGAVGADVRRAADREPAAGAAARPCGHRGAVPRRGRCPRRRAGGRPAPLFAKLGARGAGKALVSLEALRELSLLEQRETPQGARWCLVPAGAKGPGVRADYARTGGGAVMEEKAKNAVKTF